MLSHAAVLKATIYTEFWTDWSIRTLNSEMLLQLTFEHR